MFLLGLNYGTMGTFHCAHRCYFLTLFFLFSFSSLGFFLSFSLDENLFGEYISYELSNIGSLKSFNNISVTLPISLSFLQKTNTYLLSFQLRFRFLLNHLVILINNGLSNDTFRSTQFHHRFVHCFELFIYHL